MDRATEITDAELLARTARGDRVAFALLYDRHAPALYGLALRMLGREDEAQDALQDAFLRLWRRAGSFDADRGVARAWLAVMTRNLCLDRLRRRSAALRLEVPAEKGEDGEELPLPSGETAALEALEEDELRAAVRAVLAGLPAPQRAALEAAYFQGLSQSEIARRTGDPLGTVKTRMRLGMSKLLEGLEPYLGRRHGTRGA